MHNICKPYACRLDWLSFTFSVSSSDLLDESGVIHSPFDVFTKAFPELQIFYDDVVFDTGKFHYSHRYIFSDSIEINCCELEKVSGGKVNLDYAVKMGVNVSIPSHSLSLFASLFDINIDESGAIAKLLSLLKLRNCKFSRIDFCFDDFDKVFTAFQYGAWWFNDQISTKFRNCSVVGSQGKVGNTFYLGDRRHRMLRVYDKFFESKGVVDSVRYEWEYHASDADKLANLIIANNGIISFHYMLTSWLRVLCRSCDSASNRTQVNTLPEWAQFVEERNFDEELLIPEYNSKERETLINHFVRYQCMSSVRGFIRLNGWNAFIECLKLDNVGSERYEKYINIRSKRDSFFEPFDIDSIIVPDEDF